jgi:hypothetical protein
MIVKRPAVAAAAALVATSALSGAAAVPGAATEKGQTMHTKRLVVREVESQSLGDRTFTGTDRIRSRWSGKVVGYDSYTGKFYQRQEKVVLDMANALKGGIIVTA